MSDSTIERGIPIPPRDKEPIEKKYPELMILEVGDCFLARNTPLTFHLEVAMFGIKRDQRHEVRKESGDDYRVWRTK
jgi:hypothetical protein